MKVSIENKCLQYIRLQAKFYLQNFVKIDSIFDKTELQQDFGILQELLDSCTLCVSVFLEGPEATYDWAMSRFLLYCLSKFQHNFLFSDAIHQNKAPSAWGCETALQHDSFSSMFNCRNCVV